MSPQRRIYKHEIYENEFSKVIFKYIQMIFINHATYLENFTQDVDALVDTLYKILNDEERYVSSVSRLVFDISNIFDQLTHIPIYIRYYPRLKSYRNNGITKDVYIRYQLENHFIRVSTIIDQVALLINEVYRLGLPVYRCSLDAILENSNTRGTKAAKILKEFKKSSQGIKLVRNRIVHQGAFFDKDIFNLATYIFINEQNGEEIISEAHIKWLHKYIVYDKVRLLEKNNEAILHYITAIYNELLTPFVETYNYLKEKRIRTPNSKQGNS